MRFAVFPISPFTNFLKKELLDIFPEFFPDFSNLFLSDNPLRGSSTAFTFGKDKPNRVFFFFLKNVCQNSVNLVFQFSS